MTASARYLSRLSPLLLLLLQTKLQGTVLLSGPQKSLNAEERKVAAVGSSVLFLAPDIPSSIKIIQWEFINDLPLHVIVEYNSQDKSITVYPPFNDRIHFSPSNGSLLLNDVQKNDSGTYKAIINLDEQKARRTKLEVLEPVSLIQLRSSTRRAGSVIELSCGAKGDRINSFEWKKDGQPLPAERCYQLPGNHSVLFIMEGKKLDCGFFSCNVSNEISWMENSLSLIIEGISPSLHLVQNLSAATLILVVVVGAGFIFHHYQVQTHGSDGWVIRYFISIHGLLALSAILLCSAAVKWMEEKGPSAVFVLLTLALIGVAVVAFTMFIVGACHPEKFPELQTKKSTHIILDFITRGGVILLLVSACFLITHIQELQEEGCSQHGNLATAFVITSVVMLVVACLVLVICLQWNHRKIKNPRRERRRGSQREVEEEEATSS
ncbi:hepatocyte cell adhesion molecule-like isoform X3 [Tachyglossus aculeatus]|nr:hepatocyte cell adhesion molecule-like isoform X3 [Tachyglossus aculeatus]